MGNSPERQSSDVNKYFEQKREKRKEWQQDIQYWENSGEWIAYLREEFENMNTKWAKRIIKFLDKRDTRFDLEIKNALAYRYFLTSRHQSLLIEEQPGLPENFHDFLNKNPYISIIYEHLMDQNLPFCKIVYIFQEGVLKSYQKRKEENLLKDMCDLKSLLKVFCEHFHYAICVFYTHEHAYINELYYMKILIIDEVLCSEILTILKDEFKEVFSEENEVYNRSLQLITEEHLLDLNEYVEKINIDPAVKTLLRISYLNSIKQMIDSIYQALEKFRMGFVKAGISLDIWVDLKLDLFVYAIWKGRIFDLPIYLKIIEVFLEKLIPFNLEHTFVSFVTAIDKINMMVNN